MSEEHIPDGQCEWLGCACKGRIVLYETYWCVSHAKAIVKQAESDGMVEGMHEDLKVLIECAKRYYGVIDLQLVRERGF